MTEHAGADNPHTRKIAEFVSTLTYERIPAAVRERIKLLILDSLGCAIYGAKLEWCRIPQSEIVEKFRKLTRHAMTPARQTALVEAVLGLDDLPDSRRLVDLLRTEQAVDGGSDGTRTRDLRRDRPTL